MMTEKNKNNLENKNENTVVIDSYLYLPLSLLKTTFCHTFHFHVTLKPFKNLIISPRLSENGLRHINWHSCCTEVLGLMLLTPMSSGLTCGKQVLPMTHGHIHQTQNPPLLCRTLTKL